MMSDKKLDQKILERTVSFHDDLIESLKDPEHAAIYVQVALEEYREDGDLDFFMLGLRNVLTAYDEDQASKAAAPKKKRRTKLKLSA